MLYCGEPHQAHKRMAEAIDADLMQGERANPAKRIKTAWETDMGNRPVITEGAEPLFQAAWMKIFGNVGPVIHLAADEGLMNIFNKLPHYRHIDRLAHSWEHQYVDGVLAVSPRLMSEARALGVENTKLIHPFTKDEKYDGLVESQPNIGSNQILALGMNKDANNFAVLDEVIKQVNIDVEIDVVGGGTNDLNLQSDHITIHGFLRHDEFIHKFGEAEAYILPSYSQAFPVTVLEAMHAGLPPLITDEVGTQGYVKQIAPQLVTSTDVNSIADAVEWYISLSTSRKHELSEKAKKMGEYFTPNQGLKSFEVAYSQIISRINGTSRKAQMPTNYSN